LQVLNRLRRTVFNDGDVGRCQLLNGRAIDSRVEVEPDER